MRASIIIVGLNGIGYLEDCLSSLIPEINDDEIILVDNASSDGGPDFVGTHYPNVRLLRNAENKGFAAACNQGAQIANGEILVFLNQDTQVLAGWLTALLASLHQSPMVGLTTSKLLLMSEPDQIHLCGQDIHFTGFSSGRGFQTPATSFCEPAAVAAVSGAAFAIRKDLWERLGGFDEAFFMYYEETDLSWRAMLAGYHCLYVPASIALHDYHLGKPRWHALYYSKRNRYLLLFKNWRLFTLVLISPALLLAELIDWLHCILIGRLAIQAKWQAWTWVISNYRSILYSRRKVQAARIHGDRRLLQVCTSSINPREFSGGLVGRLGAGLSNALFELNYWFANILLGRLARED
ncbi:MAG: glycosyltransferase family 2 protein [Anaerolineales bacterium]|nr:glycosyltransferase family 2 protein [Anaerolineales bacterium]